VCLHLNTILLYLSASVHTNIFRPIDIANIHNKSLITYCSHRQGITGKDHGKQATSAVVAGRRCGPFCEQSRKSTRHRCFSLHMTQGTYGRHDTTTGKPQESRGKGQRGSRELHFYLSRGEWQVSRDARSAFALRRSMGVRAEDGPCSKDLWM
jgi:hypothetical protein